MMIDAALLLATVVTASWTVAFADFEGDQCSTKKDEDGVCKTLLECPSSNEILKNRKALSQIPKLFNRCGFSGRNELICCPNSDFTTTPTISEKFSMRKSEKECRSYKKLFEDEGESVAPHIFYGVEAEDAEFPHMAALGFKKAFDCGGTVISKRYILTAAHCIIKLDNNKPDVARIGVNVLSSAQPDNDYDIENIIVHPQYNRSVKYHDIALVKLARDIEFSASKRPACLYIDSKEPKDEIITVSGWGTTENDTLKFSDVLLKATMKLTSNEECNEKYTKQSTRRLPNGILSSQMCAKGASSHSDTCQGDSGGPLQFYDPEIKVYRLIGVTSFGRSCGGSTPGVYIRVSNYLDWIESHVWP